MKLVEKLEKKYFNFKISDCNEKPSCELITDFNELDKDMEIWKAERQAKCAIYIAFRDYIICLENSLKKETDSYKRYLIEREIVTVKNEQKRYCVASILEIDSYNYKSSSEKNIEKNSFWLVKKIKKK